MFDELPLLMYRVSGWSVNLATLIIMWYTLRTIKIWQGKYIFLAIDFCMTAISQLIASASAILAENNLVIDHIIIPLDFALLNFYLMQQYKSPTIKYFTIFIVILFALIQANVSLNLEGYKNYNFLGLYGLTGELFIYSLINLTFLFKKKTNYSRLRFNPDFWFTATIFSLCFVGILAAILNQVSYDPMVAVYIFYLINVPYNLFISASMFGNYKGIKLLR